MHLIDFNGYEQNARMYGGTAGRKIGITHDGKNYILKFPGNLREQNMKNIQLSYSNSPVCEFIGSQIYAILGLAVHETILGTRNGKVVVACGDFLKNEEKLYEFDKIKVTFEPHFLDSNGNETNGVGVDLYEIRMTIQEHPFLKDVPELQQHFWDMFVVDALIGNTDRNNSNWGIIVGDRGEKKIAPVYDNGNCLNSKWDDEKIQSVLRDEKILEAEAYKARRCIFEAEGKRINPYHLMERMEYPECSEAVRRITPRIGRTLEEIRKLIREIPVLSEVQKQFFITIIEMRYEQVLVPVCRRVMEQEIELENSSKDQQEGRCR
jgi:hypothetical protein